MKTTMKAADAEMKITQYLLKMAKEFGWVVVKIDDGNGYKAAPSDDDELLDQIFSGDEARLCFSNPGHPYCWAQLAFKGHGRGTLRDHSDPVKDVGGWNSMIKLVDEYARSA